jgi:UDP-3-O-[3-hydroxymyristoyl] glucosamine N-acyltransferase
LKLDNLIECIHVAVDWVIKDSAEIEIGGIVPPNQLESNRLIIIADKKSFLNFTRTLENHFNGIENLAVVIADDLWKNSKERDIFYEKIKFLGICKESALLLTRASKVFYDKKLKGVNISVDGRENSCAEIDSESIISPGVFLGENIKIGKRVKIHPNAVIMHNSVIGDDSEIFPNVTIYPWVVIGRNCRIHSSCVIGSDGYGYQFLNGEHCKIWHFGGVVIEDDVELGGLSSVDGGTFTPTRIGRGTKIDTQVQVAHNCQVGKGVILCGHVALGGSSTIGDYCVFGGKAGVINGATIGRESKIGGGALVNRDWPEKSILGGHPARPLNEWLRGLAVIKKMALRH